jgi:hypothetical protein
MKPGTFSQAAMLNFKFLKELKNAAEDVPAEQSPACQDPRFSGKDENPGWPARAEGEKGQGPQTCFGRALLG